MMAEHITGKASLTLAAEFGDSLALIPASLRHLQRMAFVDFSQGQTVLIRRSHYTAYERVCSSVK